MPWSVCVMVRVVVPMGCLGEVVCHPSGSRWGAARLCDWPKRTSVGCQSVGCQVVVGRLAGFWVLSPSWPVVLLPQA